MNKVIDIISHYSYFTDCFEERVKYSKELFENGMSIYDIRRLVREKYNLPFDERIISLDCLYHCFYVKLKYIYKIENVEDITDRLPINLRDKWKERFEYRNHLIKNNKLSYIEIEKKINNKYNIDCDLSIFSNNINVFYDIILVVNTLNKRGRPRIPSYLKEENYGQNKEKMKEVMKEKYSLIKDIKTNMLTPEEFNKIKEKIQNENILKKLNFFVNN